MTELLTISSDFVHLESKSNRREMESINPYQTQDPEGSLEDIESDQRSGGMGGLHELN